MANLIERVTVENPYQYEDTCSHIITASTSTLVISDWMPYLTDYTVQFWYKSTSNATLLFSCDNETRSLSSTPEWNQFIFTFHADTLDDIEITFPIGEYWIYNTKAEVGNFPTDWSPHPDDTSDTILGFEERLIEAETVIRDTSFNVNKELQKISGFISRDEWQSGIDGINNSIDKVSQGYGKWYVALFDKDEFQDVVTEEADPDPAPWAEQEEVVQIDDKEKYDYTIFHGENELIEPLSEISVPDTYTGMMLIGSTTNRIVYYLTYANFKESTTLNLSFTHGKCTLYVNAIPVFSSAENATDTVSMSFDSGWNIIEIITNESSAAFGDDTDTYPVISDADTCETLNCFIAVPTKRTVKQKSLYSYFDQGIDHIRTAVGEELKIFENGYLADKQVYATYFEQTNSRFDWLIVAGSESSEFEMTQEAMTAITKQFVIKDNNGTETIIEGGEIKANAITSEMLSADAITSRNFINRTWLPSDGEPHYVDEGTRIDLLNGNIYSPGLYVNGTTGDAWFRGTVFADSGEFNGKVYAEEGEFRGTVYAEDGEFTGTVHATDGEFTGTITSTNGMIGPWHIETNSIWKGISETLGLNGTGNAYLGNLGFSLSDKLVFNSTNNTLQLKVDELLIGPSGTEVENFVNQKLSVYSIQYYTEGVPTNSNFPAKDWRSAEKEDHVGDICYDKVSGKKFRYAKFYSGVKIKFNEQSMTQDVTKDYVRIYYELENQIYVLRDIGGGYNGTENTIGGAELFVPSNDFYLLWKTDASTDQMYGFKIDSVTAAVGEKTGSVTNDISGLNNAEILATDEFPESNHGNYGNNKREMYYCYSSANIQEYESYGWVLLEDADIQLAINNSNDANRKAEEAISSFDNLVIGGRNILKFDQVMANTSNEQLEDYKLSVKTNAKDNGIYLKSDLFNTTDTYCFSFKMCKNVSQQMAQNDLRSITLSSGINGDTSYILKKVYFDNVQQTITNNYKITIPVENNTNTHYVVVIFKKQSASSNTNFFVMLNHTETDIVITRVNFWDIQLEIGTKPSGWSPAPEEIQERMNDIRAKVDANFFYKTQAPDAGLYITQFPINGQNYGSRIGPNIVLDSLGVSIFSGTTRLATYGNETYFYVPGTNTVAASLGSTGLSITKGSIQLGTNGSSDYMYFGPDRFSLYNKLIYDAGTGALDLKVDSLSIGNTNIDSYVYSDSTYYSETKPMTTSTSYPYNTWRTEEERISHIGDLCYDTSSGKLYRFKKSSRRLKITFSSNNITDSQAYDYIEFYFILDGVTCKTNKIGGTELGNKTVVIPCEDFYVYWRTDSTNNDNYGFSFSSIVATSDSPASYTRGVDFPNSSKKTLPPGVLPESDHPYGINESILWYVQPIVEGASYEWEEVTVNSLGDFGTVNLFSMSDVVLKDIISSVEEYEVSVYFSNTSTSKYMGISHELFEPEESFLISFEFIKKGGDMIALSFDSFDKYIILNCKIDGKPIEYSSEIYFSGWSDGVLDSNEKHHVEVVVQKKKQSTNSSYRSFTIDFNYGFSNAVTVQFWNIMVQKGEIFTGWSPSYTDILSKITEADMSKNYLWYKDTDGLVIYNGRDSSGNKFTIDGITNGGHEAKDLTTPNIRLTTSGMSVYKGNTRIANYGETTTFYKYGTNNAAATLDSNGLKLVSGSIVLGNKTTYNSTSSGFYLGPNGSNIIQMNVGNATDYIKWDGTNLSMNVTSLSIGGASVRSNNLFYDSSEGLIVYNGYRSGSTELVVTNASQLSSLESGNIRLKSDGLQIYKGTVRVATYGETITIGNSRKNHMKINSDSLQLNYDNITAAQLSSSGLNVSKGYIGPWTIGQYALTMQTPPYVEGDGFIIPDEEDDGDFATPTNLYIGKNGIRYNGFMVDVQGKCGASYLSAPTITGETLYINSIITRDDLAIGSASSSGYQGKADFWGTKGHVSIAPYNNNQMFSIQYKDPDDHNNFKTRFWINDQGGMYISNNGTYNIELSEMRFKFSKWNNGVGQWREFGYDGVDEVLYTKPNNYSNEFSFTVSAASGVLWARGGTSSDEREKDIVDNRIKDYKEVFMKINPITFKWKDKRDDMFHIGVGARETEKYLFENGLINYAISQNNNDKYSVKYEELFMLSIPVVQDHERQIQELQDEIKQLRSEIKSLKEGG